MTLGTFEGNDLTDCTYIKPSEDEGGSMSCSGVEVQCSPSTRKIDCVSLEQGEWQEQAVCIFETVE